MCSKKLAESDETPTLGKQEQENLSTALIITDAYRKENQGFINTHWRFANPDQAHNEFAEMVANAQGDNAEEFGREHMNEAETKRVEIMNLDRIDKLCKTLASKLGIQLSEPGQSQSQ